MFTHKNISAVETRLVKSMKNDMRLRGLSPRTQDSYLSGVYKITKYFGREPNELSEEELKSYILYLMDTKHYAPETVRLMINGVKDLFRHTQREQGPLCAAAGNNLPAAAFILGSAPQSSFHFSRTGSQSHKDVTFNGTDECSITASRTEEGQKTCRSHQGRNLCTYFPAQLCDSPIGSWR